MKQRGEVKQDTFPFLPTHNFSISLLPLPPPGFPLALFLTHSLSPLVYINSMWRFWLLRLANYGCVLQNNWMIVECKDLKDKHRPLSLFLSFSLSVFLPFWRSFSPPSSPLFTFAHCLYLLLLYKNCERTLLQKTLDAKFGLDFFKIHLHICLFSLAVVLYLYFIIILPTLYTNVWQLTLQFFFNCYRKNSFFVFSFNVSVFVHAYLICR